MEIDKGPGIIGGDRLSQPAWTERKLIGTIELDTITDDKQLILKGFEKTWPDGSKCLDIMKYVIKPDGSESLFQPIQHIQIPEKLSKPFRVLFINKEERT
jgi:hypothetical protein